MLLTDLKSGLSLIGLEPSVIVSVIAAVPIGEGAIQIIYRLPSGTMRERLVTSVDVGSLSVATVERPWQPSPIFRDRPVGGAKATLRLNNLLHGKCYILAGGRHVEALAPPGIRIKIAAAIGANAVETANLFNRENAVGTAGPSITERASSKN